MSKENIALKSAQRKPIEGRIATNPIQRLERALGIALRRVHGGDERHALLLANTLEDDPEAPDYAPRAYEAWEDAKRLVNTLEALEAAEGVEHVWVKPNPSYLDELYSMPSQDLTGLFRMALDQGDQYTADLARDVLYTRETLDFFLTRLSNRLLKRKPEEAPRE